MLEIRYRIDTGKITASAYSPELTGGHLEPKDGEGIAVFDMFTPETIEAWLYDKVSQSLIPNPDYVEPAPPRDLKAEIDGLKAWRVKMEAAK